jgi:PhnB protein
MKMNKRNYVPEGWPVVIPRIVSNQPQQLVEFIKNVFGATGDYLTERPTVLNIGESMIMISGAGVRDPMPGFFYVYVADTDETYRRAIQAGAESLGKPGDVPYGDRRAMLKDQWGNVWQIATYKK